MTYFIKIENNQPVGYPLIEENIRQLFPQLPQLITPENIEPFGYGIYDFSNQPNLARYEKAVEITPVRDHYGIFRQTWSVVEMTDEEKLKVDEEKAYSVRNIRTGKLYSSDWTQLPDAQVDKNAWLIYRQQLRDITTQEGFPWSVVWPTEPK